MGELHEAAQLLADPGAAEVIVGVVSGGGSLEFDSDSSFVVSFESLVLSYEFPPDDPGPLPVGSVSDHEMVFDGEARAEFELDGNVLSVTDTSGPGLEIMNWFTVVGHDSRREGPTLFFHPAALVLGADFVPPKVEGDVVVQCDGDRLVVDPVFDSDSVDAVPAVWRRR